MSRISTKVYTPRPRWDAPLDQWRVVVSATDDAFNVTEIGDRVAFPPDDKETGVEQAAA
jgi:hypothetical protein